MMDSDGLHTDTVTNRRIDAKFLQAHVRPEAVLIDMRSSAHDITLATQKIGFIIK